jgi:sodium/hydrogen antiporter
MHHFDLSLALIGFLVIALGIGSKKLERLPVPLPLLAVLFGIVIGPAGLGLIDIAEIGDRRAVVEAATRVALAIGLIGVALRVPKEYPRQRWREMVVLTGLGMPLMWLLSTGILHLLLGMPLLVAALLGAIITPTDPIAASPVVTGPLADENLPESVRDAISFDSGANDGLTYLFVFLPLLVLTLPGGAVAREYLLHTMLWQVVFATVVGYGIGWVAGRLLEAAERRDLIEEDWRLVYAAGLSLLTAGLGRVMGSDELVLVFAAGVAFVQVVTSEERSAEEVGQEAINRFFVAPTYALLGLTIPWAGWVELGWDGVAAAVAVLLLRRPVTLLLLRPLLSDLRPLRSTLFVGWFGPIGIAALYYVALAEHHHAMPLAWPLVTLMVFSSAVAHGVTGAPLTRLYGRAWRQGAAGPRTTRTSGPGAAADSSGSRP